MKPTGKEQDKQQKDAEEAKSSAPHTNKGPVSGKETPENQPTDEHSSQGHATDAKGTATSTREATLRAATTDSSRAPKSSADDQPTGGNVR